MVTMLLLEIAGNHFPLRVYNRGRSLGENPRRKAHTSHVKHKL